MNFYFGAKNVNATDAETPSGSGAKARSFPPSKSQKKKKNYKMRNQSAGHNLWNHVSFSRPCRRRVSPRSPITQSPSKKMYRCIYSRVVAYYTFASFGAQHAPTFFFCSASFKKQTKKKWILIVVQFDWNEIHRQIFKNGHGNLKKYPILRHLRRPEFQTELSTYF